MWSFESSKKFHNLLCYTVYVSSHNCFCFAGLDKWQHTISSGFDRIVAFASTELDKRRRSTEGGGGGNGAVSCNTSPDSGIGHGDPPPAPPPSNKMPRLFRPSPGRESPPSGPPRTPSPSSPPPLLPMDGPYSPAHAPASPPPLAPSVPLRYQRNTTTTTTDHHFKKKFFHHKGKFRPKGKGWDWHQTSDAEPWC